MRVYEISTESYDECTLALRVESRSRHQVMCTTRIKSTLGVSVRVPPIKSTLLEPRKALLDGEPLFFNPTRLR